MSQTNKKTSFVAPTFQWRFLVPKFWGTWLVIIFLYLLSWLPFRLQLMLGKSLGALLHKLVKSRRKIADKNLQLCFPDMDENQRAQLVKANFENMGFAMLESGIAWWWPSWRLKSMVKFKGTEHIEAAQQQGKGVFLLFTHVLPLEMMVRTLGERWNYAGFYRPHNNALLEWVQYRGRHQGKNPMISKRDVKGLLKALSKGEVCVYLPDHDYGKKRSVFVPFFAVEEAATTTGTEIFASHKNAVTIPTKLQRLPNGQGYEIEFLPPFQDFPTGDSTQNAVIVNRWVEQSILANREQYMWVHRRFKTRPEHAPQSLY
ncbi:MAG: LpxL/LpxP family Kdo(2)-lipid IV(A) lauroyl/palmitoleoyl acyltransferase [Gammaproteobacteria bacterium]|nr:LpxL/LpxP family Kdo(2)-lipid IV(A) lauroyl/palmitoleoyl acyltransferase [Gammaproteobacteria bacterium]